MKALIVGSALLVSLSLAPAPAAAQDQMPHPWASPASRVSQAIGISEVTVTAGRPAVKGRAVWGDLVPYGEVWRAGANENTTLSCTHDITVEGRPLPAGTYGVHMIPTASTWTVIFSRNSSSWGSFTYDPAEDALRVDVTPVAVPATEWLTWEFDDLSATGATLRMRWEKLAVNLKVGVDTPRVVLANARDSFLRGVNGFFWQGWDEAARYCLNNRTNLEEGLSWAERSVALSPNFRNLWTQGGLLSALGRTDEAAQVRDQAMSLAAEVDLNNLGYQYLQAGKLDEAFTVFKKNVDLHGAESWNVHDSLAECYALKGEKAKAIELYGKALSMTTDEMQKARIQGELKKLGAQ